MAGKGTRESMKQAENKEEEKEGELEIDWINFSCSNCTDYVAWKVSLGPHINSVN